MKFLVWISDNINGFASDMGPCENMCAVRNVDIENIAILLELVKAGVIAIAIQKEGDEQ